MYEILNDISDYGFKNIINQEPVFEFKKSDPSKLYVLNDELLKKVIFDKSNLEFLLLYPIFQSYFHD